MIDAAKTYRTLVTVGTHEQSFDRLVKAADELAVEHKLPEPVFVQTGVSCYAPIHCDWNRFTSPDDMEQLMRRAEVIITHGGASTFMAAVSMGKVPIVMPRRVAFKEHVNDHQWVFAKAVEQRLGGIIVVDDVNDLTAAVGKSTTADMPRFKSNTDSFCKRLSEIVDTLVR